MEIHGNLQIHVKYIYVQCFSSISVVLMLHVKKQSKNVILFDGKIKSQQAVGKNVDRCLSFSAKKKKKFSENLFAAGLSQISHK